MWIMRVRDSISYMHIMRVGIVFHMWIMRAKDSISYMCIMRVGIVFHTCGIFVLGIVSCLKDRASGRLSPLITASHLTCSQI